MVTYMYRGFIFCRQHVIVTTRIPVQLSPATLTFTKTKKHFSVSGEFIMINYCLQKNQTYHVQHMMKN